MAKPPSTPPHSDLDGVNQDARAGRADTDHPNPGGAIHHAKKEGKGRPPESAPPESDATEGH